MRIPITSCPKCGKMLDSVSDPTGEYTPSPGDFTVCFGCAHLMVFNSGFALREPTLWEAYRASHNPEIQMLREAVEEIISMRRNRQ